MHNCVGQDIQENKNKDKRKRRKGRRRPKIKKIS
jgi:hypothetical protein